MEDRYEILDVVARGSMATVWRAQDARLGRIVAIKRPDTGAGSTDPAFATTARSAAAATHPNLVTIFDTGTDATGPYVVMEFVDGPTLAEMGGAPGGVAVLGSEIASGLSALHAAGIVHRDVRPSNILLGPTGSKLSDFATARALESRSNVTGPRFEAPEVLAGGEPTSAADVYSLGAVLSWLTGQNPPDQELSSVIGEAMSENPDARPTAATLAERLRTIGAPPPATPVTAPPIGEAPPSDEATRIFHTPPVTSGRDVSEPIEPDSDAARRRRRIAAVVAMMLVAVVVAVVAAGGDDDTQLAGDTTIVDPTTTTSPVETAAPETTVEEESGGVFETVRVFITFIREAPGDALTNSGAEEIISNVVDGVSEAIRGNDEQAETEFNDAVETAQDEIEDETVIDRAIELIGRLARQLGIDVESLPDPSG